jgi:hypothetical protein
MTDAKFVRESTLRAIALIVTACAAAVARTRPIAMSER